MGVRRVRPETETERSFGRKTPPRARRLLPDETWVLWLYFLGRILSHFAENRRKGGTSRQLLICVASPEVKEAPVGETTESGEGNVCRCDLARPSFYSLTENLLQSRVKRREGKRREEEGQRTVATDWSSTADGRQERTGVEEHRHHHGDESVRVRATVRPADQRGK